jgi:hypothetical protein
MYYHSFCSFEIANPRLKSTGMILPLPNVHSKLGAYDLVVEGEHCPMQCAYSQLYSTDTSRVTLSTDEGRPEKKIMILEGKKCDISVCCRKIKIKQRRDYYPQSNTMSMYNTTNITYVYILLVLIKISSNSSDKWLMPKSLLCLKSKDF